MKKILFIGAGRMATAIAGGMVNQNYDKDLISSFDINESACRSFEESTGIKSYSNNLKELIEQADVVCIAVKPQYITTALANLDGILCSKLIISIVAGVSIDKLKTLTESRRIVRVMPNTPALVGKGCSGYTASENVSEDELKFAESLLNSFGISIKFQEKLMDAVTALSGSGPAYLFEFVDAISEGGTNCGISKDLALEMTIATFEGALEMIKKTKLPPSVLKDQVTSPGGTTLRALNIMEDNNVRKSLIRAVEGACERSKELGKNV